MRAKRAAPSDAPRNWSAAEAASPASFQPVKAQTRAGARRPSGRCSQMRGCIRSTVHHGFVATPGIATLRPGDLVRVAGGVERFRDALQAALQASARVRPAEADPAAFLPVAHRDLDELDGFLEHLAGEVRQPALQALLASVLADAGLRAGLRRSPCTRAG